MDNNSNIDFNSKSEFFRGGYFVVTLSMFETSEKVFVPGHRFLPFLNPAVKPWTIEILSARGRMLSKKVVSTGLENLKPFYNLYGEERFLFLLIDDRNENAKTIIDNTGNRYSLNATAYDIGPLLEEEEPEEWQKNTPLSLLFRINDWEKGIYTASVKRGISPGIEAGEWVDLLEEGFKTALEKSRKMKIVPEVMSDAFFYGGKVLLENPVVSLEDFFELSETDNVADLLAEQKEDPVLEEKKRFIREKTVNLIKKLALWLEAGDEDRKFDQKAAAVLENQVLMTKKTLIAVLEELNNPFVGDDLLNKMSDVITDSENLVSRIT